MWEDVDAVLFADSTTDVAFCAAEARMLVALFMTEATTDEADEIMGETEDDVSELATLFSVLLSITGLGVIVWKAGCVTLWPIVG